MRVAIRQDDIYPENCWHDWCTEEVLTGSPYNYQITVIPDDLDAEVLGYDCFDLTGGKYIYNAQKYADKLKQQTQSRLRIQRELECFPVINRGGLWYEQLTQAQQEELRVWYQAWLDVTVSLTIPDRPAWIDM